MDLAKLVVKLEAQTADYQKKLDQATSRLERFKKANEGMLSGLGSKLAGAFAVGTIVAWGKHVIEGASRLHDLAQESGVSVERLQELKNAAAQSGVNIEDLGTAFKKLNKNISEAAGDPSSQAATAFKQLGIAVTDANGNLRTADAVMNDLADRFHNFKDGPNKAAIALTLMGKAGTGMIPVLNEGATGLDKFAQQARAAGTVLSEETINKMDELGDRLTVMKDSLVTGLGGAILERLLPAFEGLGKSWTENGNAAQAYADIADGVVVTLKVLGTAGLYVWGVFSDFGRAVVTTAEAIYEAAHGRIRAAGELLGGIGAELEKQDADTMRRIKGLWEGAQDPLDEFVVTAKKRMADAPDIFGGKKLADAAKKARDELQKLSTDLRTQVATFGMSDAAVLHYRLTLGDLADEVKVTGAAGRKMAADIEAQAAALDKMNAAKAAAEGLKEVNQQLLQLRGDTAGATAFQFDTQNLELMTNLAKAGDLAGMQQLNTLRELTVAQAQYNQLQTDAQSIQDDLAITEERIRNSRETGALTEIQQAQALDAARVTAHDRLASIYEQMKKIADESGNPELVRGAKQMGAAIEQLGAQTNLLGKQFKAVFEDGLGTALEGVLNGTKSVSDAMKGLLSDLEAQLAKMVANDLVTRLFGALSGMGGGAGGFFGAIGSLFGGGRDSGGRGTPGQVYAIGAGAQPEYFVPDSHGSFYPKGKGMGGGGGVSVTNHFNIQAPNGTVSRQTQQQIGAAAARGMLMAQRRNA